MSRILAIRGTEGEKKVDYSFLSLREIQKRIKAYEKRYGSYSRFLKGYDCESSPTEDYLTLIDWECLSDELKSRKGIALSLVKGNKGKSR